MGETYCTTDGIFQIPDLTLIKPTQKEKETAMGRGRLKGGGGVRGRQRRKEMRDGERLGRRKGEGKKKEVLRGTILQQTKSF